MKKLSVLIATALLGTAPVTYADELNDLLNDLGIVTPLEVPPETGELPSEVQAFIWTIPTEIAWDNSNVVDDMQLCGIEAPKMDDTTLPPGAKRVMGRFEVTATGSFGTETAYFEHQEPPGNEGGGEAVSPTGAWKLKQFGRETWEKPWKIEVSPGETMYSIELNLLSERDVKPRTKHFFAGFDILLRPNDNYDPYDLGPPTGSHPHPSPGSGAGWPVDEQPPFKSEGISLADYTATFYDPIVLPGETLENPHDLYGKVIIDFVIDNENGVVVQNGIQGDAGVQNLAFAFWQDTDCLPTEKFSVTNVIASETGNYEAFYEISTGLGMNVYVTRSRGLNTPQDEREVFEYIGYFGSDTGAHTGSIYVEPGFCYWAEDWTDTGLKEDKFGGCL